MLGQLGSTEYPDDVLVSAETRDDAAAYRLPDGRALVQTVDFFTPIVDDPFDWGRIAAANAASDVYAMGRGPCWRSTSWPGRSRSCRWTSWPGSWRGGEVAARAGFVVVGGHSIHDPEPKYGMAVTGFADADRIVRSSTAPPGAALFLTKPLGLGIITTAIKEGRATTSRSRWPWPMTELNAAAAEAMVEVEAEAATDVTGFGLLGHLHNVLRGSGLAAEVDASAVPLLEGTVELAEDGLIPAGPGRMPAYLDEVVDWGDLPEPGRLACGGRPDLRGGLLIAATDGERLRSALEARHVRFAEIGRTAAGDAGRITVRGAKSPAGNPTSLVALLGEVIELPRSMFEDMVAHAREPSPARPAG